MYGLRRRYLSLSITLGLGLAACGSGGQGGVVIDPGGDLFVLRTSPADNGRVYLNEPIRIDLSQPLDPRSVNFSSLSFVVFDLNGNQLNEPVLGSLVVGRSTGDTELGRRLEFWPRLPQADDFSDGGFRPGRRYIMQLVKGDPRINVGLQDRAGRGLQRAYTFSFQSAEGSVPGQLFRDPKAGGPRRSSFAVTPKDPTTGEVELNELGQAPVEIRLGFDQALNPHSANLPLGLDLDPARRSVSGRGRVFLEYDDPEGKNTWIPARVDLARNDVEGAELVLRPLGVLPNNASVRVIVESSLEDIAGQSNADDAAYERVFAEFKTSSGYELRFDALVENFDDTSRIDLQAPFLEPMAALLPGAVRASFAFEGGESALDYEPDSRETVLDTDFTQITPKNGQTMNVSNGVFTFRNVRIPAGVTVRGVGSRPMVWLVNQDFVVEGRLLVEGGDGARVNTLRSANFPAGGGVAGPGGGNGGQGSPNTTDRSARGQAGFGPGQVPGAGGAGGQLDCEAGCGRGSGGGGGSFATQGDPNYKVQATNFFVQPRGIGGYGCTSRNSTQRPGGAPGPLGFSDGRPANNFWGALVDVYAQRRISGELAAPRGGAGGGGGGDLGPACSSDPLGFQNDAKAGGGGGGGGVLIIKALGDIVIHEDGLISADGGDGNGGAWAGSNNRAGGGGGGSGGMVVLMAGQQIKIHAHGEIYQNNDYRFAVSADGGVSQVTPYGSGTFIYGKYQPEPHRTSAGALNESPCGGYGGFGVVQLMAPPGDNTDGTNTALDDNIVVYINGVPAGAADKQRYLGWRGVPDASGVFRDDLGREVGLAEGEGDIRPSPVLMPAPFGRRSRLRSVWVDLGAAARRNTPAGGDGLPRGVERQGALPLGSTFGPLPGFAGVIAGDPEAGSGAEPDAGFIATRPRSAGGVAIRYPTILEDLAVAEVEAAVRYRGAAAMRLRLRSPEARLAAVPGRYSHYRAVLHEGGVELGQFRILGHGAGHLYLSAEDGSLESVGAGSGRRLLLDVQAKFFALFERGVEGFQQTRDAGDGTLIPKANVRIGFAFHQDPSDPQARRFPPAGAGYPFFADWGNAQALEELRMGGYRFVQFDLIFDATWQPEGVTADPDSYGAASPRPELRYLVLPYRY